MTHDDRKICKGTYHDAHRQYNACDARHYCILYRAYIKQLADNDSDYPDIPERQLLDYTGGDKPCFIETLEIKLKREIYLPDEIEWDPYEGMSIEELKDIIHKEMEFVQADKKAIWGW